MSKLKFAMYWAASCGGCEISLLNIGEDILAVDAAFDIVFWPCAADFKYKDVQGYPDGYIDLCLFNGAIRNSENEEMAHLLRRKSKTLVAFGSCAYEGCIPGLSNLTTKAATLRAAYSDSYSGDESRTVLPQPVTQVPEGELHIPLFYETVRALDQVVPVDYIMPGCPPESHQIAAVVKAIISGAELPKPGGTVIGAGQVAVCEECPLAKNVKQITRFYRPYELVPEPGLCLLEQGLLCMGPATRSGCGALCPRVNMRCEGCYGPLDGQDQGARILSAVASVVNVGKAGEGEAEMEAAIEAAMETLADPAGTFYRFSMAHSLLQRTRF
ncbi:MAG: F420-nonreducing hydrogenase [Chloroflexaceae bacterium]|jgi:F420-non-reducing hydrogenase small subunit|nr:F420-nonreducing hydrogenase [Chloroflexaceae bacterium]